MVVVFVRDLNLQHPDEALSPVTSNSLSLPTICDSLGCLRRSSTKHTLLPINYQMTKLARNISPPCWNNTCRLLSYNCHLLLLVCFQAARSNHTLLPSYSVPCCRLLPSEAVSPPNGSDDCVVLRLSAAAGVSPPDQNVRYGSARNNQSDVAWCCFFNCRQRCRRG